MAMIWFGTANHCFVVEALAEPAKATHHCCDKPSKDHGPFQTHDEGSGKACCQRFVQATNANPEIVAPVSELLPILLITQFALRDLPLERNSKPDYLPLSLGPPGEMKCVLSSLTLAPNAPPASL